MQPLASSHLFVEGACYTLEEHFSAYLRVGACVYRVTRDTLDVTEDERDASADNRGEACVALRVDALLLEFILLRLHVLVFNVLHAADDRDGVIGNDIIF